MIFMSTLARVVLELGNYRRHYRGIEFSLSKQRKYRIGPISIVSQLYTRLYLFAKLTKGGVFLLLKAVNSWGNLFRNSDKRWIPKKIHQIQAFYIISLFLI